MEKSCLHYSLKNYKNMFSIQPSLKWLSESGSGLCQIPYAKENGGHLYTERIESRQNGNPESHLYCHRVHIKLTNNPFDLYFFQFPCQLKFRILHYWLLFTHKLQIRIYSLKSGNF